MPMKTSASQTKEFKLSGWPDLPAGYRRISTRRMLDDLSARYVSLPQLARRSGASHDEVRRLLRELAGRGVLQERVAEAPAAPAWWSTLRRWLSGSLWRG
jgi:hypothetical protein